MTKPTIKEMVFFCLGKRALTRSSDNALLDMILFKYFNSKVAVFLSWNPDPVWFINSMVRHRRRMQSVWLFPAEEKVRKNRLSRSKFWADEFRQTKKTLHTTNIQKCSKVGKLGKKKK